MENKMGSFGIDTYFLKREGMRFELMKSEYNCYTQHQKRDIFDIMSCFNLDKWKMDDIRDLIKNETFKKNIDRLRYIYFMRKNENKHITYFVFDLIYNLISTIRDGIEVDFDLVVKMVEEYAQNDSRMHRVCVMDLVKSLMFNEKDNESNKFFTPATKLRLFKSTLHSTEKGEDLGYYLLHMYKVCEKRDISERRAWFLRTLRTGEDFIGRDFDSIEAFEIVEKAYEGAFDDDPIAANLIEQSFENACRSYILNKDLLEYSSESFDDAFALFKILSERLNRGGCSQDGSIKYWKTPARKSAALK